ncbi:MAG: hypothetical protein NC117_04720 [Pseudoflavonifractor sp.]|nr:hypothetical protein [Pseudoflavonifractor sp.]
MRLLSLLFLLSVVMTAHGELMRHYVTRTTMPKDSMLRVDSAATACVVEVRAALLGNTPRHGLSRQWWGMTWVDHKSGIRYELRLQCGNTDFGDILDERFAVVSVSKDRDDDSRVLFTKRLSRGIDCYDGYNSVAMEWSADSMLRVYAGNGDPRFIGVIPGKWQSPRHVRIVSEGDIDVDMAVVETEVDHTPGLDSGLTQEDIAVRLASSSDPVEGYWRYLDRETDDTVLRLGGDYRLALLRDGDGYVMVYIDGARVNDAAWSPGMVKGRLRATPFVNHFDLTWYDSLLMPMDSETHATFDGSVLTLEFPLYNRSRIRLYRESR